MRKAPALAMGLAVLLSLGAACGGFSSAEPDPAPGPADPAADPAVAGAQAVIQGLYAPYLNGGTGGRGIWTPGLTSASLAALLAADQAASEASGEIGALDYDIIANGQDFQVANLSLSASGDASRAVVVATFTNFDKPEKVTYDLIQEGGAWKIDNVRPQEGEDLRRILSRPAGQVR